MERLRLSEIGASEAARRAAETARAGGVVLFPAERLYGLMADAQNFRAVDRVFALKGRSGENAAPVLVDSPERAAEWVQLPPSAGPLIAAFWPGPLTLVLPLKKNLPAPVTGGSGKLGLRVPGNEAARLFARAVGGPITATSANRSGAPPARSVDEALDQLGAIDLAVDGGELPGPPASTVAEIDGDSLRIIRPGAICVSDLNQVWKGNLLA